MTYLSDQTFSNLDFSNSKLEAKEYDQCVFNSCNFSESNLSEVKFIECEFNDCNLSNANLSKTGFQDVTMKNCKLLGLHFEHCSNFSFEIRFENSQLDYSSFYTMKLKHCSFNDCNLQGADFTEADLNNVTIKACNLLNAIFDNTLLEKADLRSSINYSIDPENNYIRGAKFSLPAAIGLLDKYQLDIND